MMVRKKMCWGLLVLARGLAGVLMGFTACGGGNATRSTAGPATTAGGTATTAGGVATTAGGTATSAAVTDTTAAAAGGAEIDKVNVAISLEPTTMDPTSSKFAPMNFPVLPNIYDPLVAMDDKGQPDPSLSLSTWDIQDNGNTIVFTLKDGVKFQNGDPLTSADVVFTHERAMANNPEYAGYMAVGFDKVEAVDAKTVKFTFKTPNVLFLYAAATHLYLVDKAYFDKVGEQEFMAKPIGTGAYKFVEWKTGQYLDLVRNDDYWGPKPAVKAGHLVFVPDAMARVQMLQAGEVDLVDTTPWDQVKPLKDAGFNVAILDAAPSICVQFDTKNPKVPWADVRVREAIGLAIDKQSIQQQIFYGVPGLNAWPAEGEVGYNATLQPQAFDLAKAQQLMKDAGFADGFKMPLVYPAMGAEPKQAAEAVALYLKKLNITCEVQALEMSKLMESMRKWSADPAAEVVFIMSPAMRGTPNAVIGLQRQFFSKNPMGVYANAQVDTDIEQAAATYDNTKRGQLIADAFATIAKDFAVAPIVAGVTAYGTSKNITFVPAAQDPAVIYLSHISAK
jgi:peptide/nickel transport system substrate-binding protein